MEITPKITEAIGKYRARLDMRDTPVGRLNPANGRWTPSVTHKEKQSCCEVLMQTGRSTGWELFTHCMSPRHIGIMTGLEGQELLDFVAWADVFVFDRKLAAGDGEEEDIDDTEAYK